MAFISNLWQNQVISDIINSDVNKKIKKNFKPQNQNEIIRGKTY